MGIMLKETSVDASAKLESCLAHISNWISGHIRNVASDACATSAHVFVASRLDYGNALLGGILSTLMGRL